LHWNFTAPCPAGKTVQAIMNIRDINLVDYDYDLPLDRIAQYPVSKRDMSQLLIYRNHHLHKDVFRNVNNYLPAGSLLVFNNTRVIKARIIFHKQTGAEIEILCLEPLEPADYELSLGSNAPVEWKCIIGNLKKWKSAKLATSFYYNNKKFILNAEKIKPEGDAWSVRFEWNSPLITFGEVIEATGHIPLPPYINRQDESDDLIRYQTVYSRIKGSVAAPTAGLHFTANTLAELKENGINSAEITLHIGAGTFKPVKAEKISEHEMHCEHFFITSETIQLLIKSHGKIIPVGTTAVRALESLYWLGVKLKYNSHSELSLRQWDAYDLDPTLSVKESLSLLSNYMRTENLSSLHASTSLMIVPGYKFRMIDGLITNFHQPRSTLLLLVSAWIGEKWKEIYDYALNNNFRFLSYGDCSLLLS
jgi:S-adenosylmethionine:tRNA ribosyltransferase-isomerase